MLPDDYDVLNSVLDDEISRFVQAMAPETDATLEALADHNIEAGFPVVGPEVGGVLRVVARLVDAKRVFEFGSGMGYSAYWIAPVLPDDGELVLTDFEEENLDTAREFFEAGGFDAVARFEVGDALSIYREYDGPFDLVHIDNLEGEYLETFELVRDDVPSGGAVCADNVMAGPAVQTENALAALEGDDPELDDSTRGVVEFLRAVRADDEFETVLLPVGEGLLLAVKR